MTRDEQGKGTTAGSRRWICPLQSKKIMTSSFYDRLLERESRVIALEVADTESAIVQFRLASRKSGRSIYHWTETGGLQSLKADDISVPGSRPLVEALRYVVQSMHYGIYVLSGFERQMSSTPLHYLNQLYSEPQPDDRKVILISSSLRLSRPLERIAEVVVESDQQERRLRLRDGRWMMA